MHILKNRVMIDGIEKIFKISQKVKNAMSDIDRESFIPVTMSHFAYSLDALPISSQQYISSPLTVAKMSTYLAPDGGDSVLEIGCGSGYQAVVLSKMFRRVFTIERIEKLYLESKERFRKCGIVNITSKFDDGQNGWEKYAPFDKILFSACCEKIPDRIIEQLDEGGVMVAPLIEGDAQVIKRFIKKSGVLDGGEVLEKCKFVPVLNGTEKV